MTSPFAEDILRGAQRAKSNGHDERRVVFLPAAEFIDGYKPQRPLLKAWDLKPGWLYTLTAPTGSAKTAIALAESLELARKGKRVVYLAGENPDDVRARVILMMAKLQLDQLPPTLKFVDRTCNLKADLEQCAPKLWPWAASI